jgi:hypothetical protein
VAAANIHDEIHHLNGALHARSRERDASCTPLLLYVCVLVANLIKSENIKVGCGAVLHAGLIPDKRALGALEKRRARLTVNNM